MAVVSSVLHPCTRANASIYVIKAQRYGLHSKSRGFEPIWMFLKHGQLLSFSRIYAAVRQQHEGQREEIWSINLLSRIKATQPLTLVVTCKHLMTKTYYFSVAGAPGEAGDGVVQGGQLWRRERSCDE